MKLVKLFDTCNTIEYQVVGKDVNYAFKVQGDHLYIYFQGSSSIWDWVRNFLFKKVPYKDMDVKYRVHRGFLAAWKEVEDIIIDKIMECKRVTPDNPEGYSEHYDPKLDFEWKYKKITVVGYSHGGALAAFCHECVWFWRPDLRESGLVGYGFEAPRIFGAFRVPPTLKERWKTFYVVRDNNDIVTHCPPVIFRYCHVGSIIKIHGDTSLASGGFFKCIKSHYPEVVHDGLVKSDL